jgi:hypothetical protein
VDDKERTRLHRWCKVTMRGIYLAVPCVSVVQRWLKRPLEGEKKRGGRRQERGEPERRESDSEE